MGQIASFILAYLMIGVFVWIAIPTVEGASGNRPKFWRFVIGWGLSIFSSKYSTLNKWMWGKICLGKK